jgi:hypothetical protein
MHEAAIDRLAAEIRAGINELRLRLAIHEVKRDICRFRRLLLERRYNPDQPRVPAGNRDGGQWTSDGGSGEASQPREMMRRWTIPRGTPAQQMRFIAARLRADAASARALERDPTWKPPPSVTSTIEGQILHQIAVREAAEAHIRLLQDRAIIPGRYAVESIPVRGPGLPHTEAERIQNTEHGYRYGCHTCGTRDPSTSTGHFVLDHQMPTRWNTLGREQRYYPHCLTCSRQQGGYVSGLRRRIIE